MFATQRLHGGHAVRQARGPDPLCVLRRPATQRRLTTLVRSSTNAGSGATASYKKAAVMHFVDKFVKSRSVLGLGSGELVNMAIEEIGRRLATGALESVSAVPACDAAAHEAAFHGVPLLTDDKADAVDLLFDEVDQIDIKANALIKGVASEPQQPQLPRLRTVLQKASAFVVLADGSAVVPRLGGSLPVWIPDENWEEVAEELDDIFLGDGEIWRRGSFGAADNPKGGDQPYVSEDGHAIVDVRFYEGLKLFGEDEEYGKISDEIFGIQGVVTHGLVLGAACAAVLARPGAEGPQAVELQRATAAAS